MLTKNPELKPLTEETLENLRTAAGDPIDAMRLAADVYATNAYLAERALAVETGKPPPKPPRPLSKYMRSFARDFNARLAEVLERLTPDETRALGVAIERRVDDEGASVVTVLLLLMAMHPSDAARWIRTHLDELDTRFAS